MWLIVIVLRVAVPKDWSSEIAALTASAARRGVSISGVVAVGIAGVVFIGLIGVCLYVVLPAVCALQVRKGRRWPRIVIVIPTAVMVAAVPGGNFFDYLATALMVSATVCLFLRESRAFSRRPMPGPSDGR